MPGLVELKAAKPDQIGITQNDVEGGAELAYNTTEEPLANALHRWFDAQIINHEKDAVNGHSKHSSTMKH